MAVLALLIFSAILGVLALVDLVSKELGRRYLNPGRQVTPGTSQIAHKPSGSRPAAPDAEALHQATRQGDRW